MDDVFLRLQTALAGEYSIEREIGRGGMGIVYLAREVRLAREVAIKVLPPDLAGSPEMRDQFLREAQMAARLSHPNIVPIHRVDEAGGFVYFVMAYISGETLAQRIRSRGPLPPHTAARILRDVAWALTYAHSAGIVHRDVKAENILIEQGSERALVTDFGIASAAHTTARTVDGAIAGSPHYASPEQISGEPVDAASDIYSLGVVGYFALTGRLPFYAPHVSDVLTMHLSTRPLAVASIAPSVPAKLAQIVERCLAKRPEHRFPNATDLASELDRSVEPPREIPAPLRVWLNRTNNMNRAQVALALYASMGLGVPFAAATQSALVGFGVGLTTVAAVIILPITLRTKRVLAAGYGLEDFRMAIREYWMRRREEMTYELAGPNRRITSRATRWIVFGSAAAAVGFGVLAWSPFVPHPILGVLAAAAAVVSVAAAVLGVTDTIRRTRIHKLGNAQIKFFNSKWGERFVRFAGLGVKKTLPATSMPQLTEVALGRATDALYSALPKPIRKQLKALPGVIQRLESDAKTLRAEIDRLDASIADLDGDARALSSAVVDSPHEAQLRAERDHLRTSLRTTRERATDRLAATVAALENIRLDLLRLQLGDGQVSSVTASLDAAQSVAAELGAVADAHGDVENLLRDRPSSPLSISPSLTPPSFVRE